MNPNVYRDWVGEIFALYKNAQFDLAAIVNEEKNETLMHALTKNLTLIPTESTLAADLNTAEEIVTSSFIKYLIEATQDKKDREGNTFMHNARKINLDITDESSLKAAIAISTTVNELPDIAAKLYQAKNNAGRHYYDYFDNTTLSLLWKKIKELDKKTEEIVNTFKSSVVTEQLVEISTAFYQLSLGIS